MAEQQQLFKQGALTAWYDAAKSALYVNRTLREWLQSYPEVQRPEAAKLALIYGITCLRKGFGSKLLSIDELKQVTARGQHAVALNEDLPAITKGMAEIRQTLDGFDQELWSADTAHRQTSQAHEKLKQRTTACSPRGGIGAGTSVQSVDELASRSQANKAGCAQQKVYPSWWGEHPLQAASHHMKGCEQQPRSLPRLAYSVQEKTKEGPPLYSNDLVTAAFLEVPSSRYGLPYTAPAAKRTLIWEGPLCSSSSKPCHMHSKPGKENSGGAELKSDQVEVQRKPLKLKQHLPVKSRVKQQLQQAQHLHEQRGVARQTRLKAALGPRQPAAPQRFQSLPGKRSIEGGYSTDQPATDIADSILTNPWTAALLPDDADRPQLYCNSTALTRVGLGSWAPDDAVGGEQLQGRQDRDSSSTSAAVDIEGQGTTSAGDRACCESDSLHSVQRTGTVSDSCHQSHSADSPASDLTGTPQHADSNGHEIETRSPDIANARHSIQLKASMSRRPMPEQKHKPVSMPGALTEGCSNADGAAMQQPVSASVDWAAAFTSKQGTQTQGLGLAARGVDSVNSSREGTAKQRGYRSWIGDFGHLDGPRFTKQQGRAWQSYMRNQRHQPGDAAVPEDSSQLLAQEDDWKSSMIKDGDSAVPDNPGDGRWDFAKILGQDA